MCKEENTKKNREIKDIKNKLNINDSTIKTINKRRTGGNGWRDILDELECSSGPGDNIYVFG